MFKNISTTIAESRQKERGETLAEAEEMLEVLLAGKKALENHIRKHDQDRESYITYKMMQLREEGKPNQPLDEKLVAKIRKDAEASFKETLKTDMSALAGLENQIQKKLEEINKAKKAQGKTP